MRMRFFVYQNTAHQLSTLSGPLCVFYRSLVLALPDILNFLHVLLNSASQTFSCQALWVGDDIEDQIFGKTNATPHLNLDLKTQQTQRCVGYCSPRM